MKNIRAITFIALLVSNQFAFSQTETDTIAIQNELNAIFERDQYIRKSDDSAQFRTMIDSINLSKVEALITKYGWPGKSFVGVKGNYTVWLVIQHAELETQEKYLPLFEKSVADSESRAIDLAYLKDRVLMRQNKNQIYGTQVWMNSATGLQEFWPIEDEKNVNARRASLGMSPIEEYAQLFGIHYKSTAK